jgi:hypothetical protein
MNEVDPVKDGDKIVVWFSCGAPSAIAAKLTLELYGNRCKIHIVNNPVAEEDKDNRRFLKDIEKWLNHPVEIAYNSKYPNASAVEVWDERKFMSSPYGAPCTVELKKEARYQWEVRNSPDWHVMGYTAEEEHRHERFIKFERSNLLPILINAHLTKPDCFELIQGIGIDLPITYDQGYPNANCIGCVKATSPTYWNQVRKMHPAIFEARAIQSRRLGAKLVKYKNKRIFLDELPENATGRPLKSMQHECGIFCFTGRTDKP